MVHPVYVLHMPVLGYVGVGLGHFVRGPVIAMAASVAVAAAWRWYDRPVRTWLSRKLLTGARQVSPRRAGVVPPTACPDFG